jgi:2,3,4,5-tetrahydropyridine-2,6-dicarboxylate N-succinyltransferase
MMLKMALKLKNKVESFFADTKQDEKLALELFFEVRRCLEAGTLRAAENIKGQWVVNMWVKQAILLGFKYGVLQEVTRDGVNNNSCNNLWQFFDKHTLPLHDLTLAANVRMVPGGSAIRSGSYVAPGTIIMPPSYINIGAYIDVGCMIDSHALVGSCAQVGKNVHLSAASQIGGVLEPVGALPVIIEDDVFIGGNCGIYEGTIVSAGCVIGTGVILNASTPVFDNTTGEFIKKTATNPLIIPQYAVVIAGSRPIKSGYGRDEAMHIYCPIIIKYRDAKTAKAITLEDMLR